MKKILIYLSVLLCCACTVQEPTAQKTLNTLPDIFPDYTDVTIPCNIAPLRFMLKNQSAESVAVLTSGNQKIIEEADNGKFLFSENQWKSLTEEAIGGDIQVKIYEKQNDIWAVYKEFPIHVATDSIDTHIAYRLIPPGYEPWYNLGIYQRDLTSYTEKAVLENKQTDGNCMNCHSFCMQNPDKMLFHMRAVHGGTYLVNENSVEKLDGNVSDDIPSLVYPYWHPSGDFIAFSTNKTMQVFHRNDSNRIEVYDEKSNVLVYDVKRHEVFTDSLLFSKKAFETFPTFSPDGKTLYFCSAAVSDSLTLPRDYKKVKYNLCSISFNTQTRSFGTKVDTLYSVREGGRSAKFPRISPDGNYLIFTISDYGNFSIWHHDADLYLYDLKKKTLAPLTQANSKDTESYHSWSSNSRWLTFSSRRENGLYTRLYFTYIDKQGKAHKPFLLPQADPDFYRDFLYSYNIPELIKGEIKVPSKTLESAAKSENSTKISLKNK